MKKGFSRWMAVLLTVCMLLSLFPGALAASPVTYVQDTDGVDSGGVYAIYTNEDDSSNHNRILYHHTGSGKTDRVTGSVSGNELTLTGGSFTDSTQLWTITAVTGGYTVQSVDSGRYLDLTSASDAGVNTSGEPVTLTIDFNAGTGLYTFSQSGGKSLSYDGNGNFFSGESAYGFRLYKQTEDSATEPEPVPTTPVIPGYTQLTEMPADGLDTSKYYLIVTKDSQDNLYALYINQAGTSVSSGKLKGDDGLCTATLTVSGDTVTAAYLNGGASVNVDDLRITVNTSGSGYTFRSGDYGLALGSNMYSTGYTALSVSVADSLWTIKNTTSGRLLSFNQRDSDWSQYPNNITDFWGPNGGKQDSFPIYLYIQEGTTVPVDKGALNAVIDEASALDGDDYTTDSWSALQTALAAAQGVADDDTATQTEVNEACAALEDAMDALVRQLTPPDSVPTATIYQKVTGPLENSGVYAIFFDGTSNGSLLYHTGTSNLTDQIGGSVSNGLLSIDTDSKWTDENVLWTFIQKEDGTCALKNVASGYYLDLTERTTNKSNTSPTEVALTITPNEDGTYNVMNGSGNALSHASTGQYYTGTVATPLYFFQKTEVQAETVEREELIPRPGSTQDEPFTPGTGGSNNFRIPSIITLDSGRILAAIDARWNHLGDACSLDTIVSYSDDGGKTWNYSFANYFGDSVDAYQANGTAFIDPVMVQGNDGTIYLMVDLFPGGVALNTAPMAPAKSSGYVEIDGVQRLVLYLSGNAGEQTDNNYACYVGDFTDGYAQVYNATDHTATGYYMDDHYYLYYSENVTTQNPEQDKIYCQQLGSSKFVQQNVFFYNAQLHVRCATYLWLVTSKDGGETWSAPTILNPQIRTGADQFYGVGPGAGLCLDDGTIMLPAYTFTSGMANSNQIASFIYSSDGGQTWHRSENATPSGHWSSESCLVQIDATTVRHFYRDGYSTLYYTDHTWDGEKWVAGTPVDTGIHKTYNNQLSAIRYSQEIDGKPVILVSTAAGNGNSRSNGKIYTFLVNEDKTMELANSYEVTASGVAYGYSSLTELEDGSISVLYEGANSRSTYINIPASEELFGDKWSPVDSGPSISTGGTHTTDTETNPDGSTTTTVTRPNGTVTETTKWPDGSSEVVETEKDGTVTTTTTDDAGNMTEVVEHVDGSSVTTVDSEDGSTSTTTVDENGQMEAQVVLSAAAVEEAADAGEAVALPMPAVYLADDQLEAPTVTVALPSGRAAKVEIPVEDVTAGTVAVLVDSDGSEEIIQNTQMTEDGVAVTLSDGDTVRIVDNTKDFGDVSDDHWGADAVDFVTSRQLFNGTGAGTFAPEADMTRAMIVTVLARYDGADTDGGQTWYEQGVQWAVANGVSDGTNLEAPVSREQLVTMLWRLAGSPVAESSLSEYPDGDGTSAWAADAMAWAVENGIVTGTDTGMLNPQNIASRVEVAAILARFIELGA